MTKKKNAHFRRFWVTRNAHFRRFWVTRKKNQTKSARTSIVACVAAKSGAVDIPKQRCSPSWRSLLATYGLRDLTEDVALTRSRDALAFRGAFYN